MSLTPEQVVRLNEIGFVWNEQYTKKLENFNFDIFLENFIKYTKEQNDEIIPFNAKICNYEIGFYARNIRTKRIKLSREQEDQLKTQGFLFDTSSKFLDTEDDESILQQMLQGDMKARAKIIEKNYKLVIYSAIKLQKFANYSDLISLGEELLLDATDRYCPNATKEKPFLGCLKYSKKYVFANMQKFIKQTKALKSPVFQTRLEKIIA